MIYVAYIAFGFAVMQLLISAVNSIFIQNWQNGGRDHGLVSVLIPARNEEENIASLLDDLQKQDYLNTEILIFDDQSEDDTARIIDRYVKTNPRISLIRSEGLPEGWLGKNHACHSLARHARGKYLLFLDADVRISKRVITHSVNYLKIHHLSLLSVFPSQIIETFEEQISIPLMNYILLTLLPLILVRMTPQKSIAAANGQFMLFDADDYHRFKPHRKMQSKLAEDIDIARYYKSNKVKVACLTGKRGIQCHMYSSYRRAIHGFSKNVLKFFGNSVVLGIAFWLLTTLGIIPVVFGLHPEFLWVYLAMLLATRVLVSAMSQQDLVKNVLYFIPQQITLIVIIYLAIRNRIKKQYEWKGRLIS